MVDRRKPLFLWGARPCSSQPANQAISEGRDPGWCIAVCHQHHYVTALTYPLLASDLTGHTIVTTACTRPRTALMTNSDRSSLCRNEVPVHLQSTFLTVISGYCRFVFSAPSMVQSKLRDQTILDERVGSPYFSGTIIPKRPTLCAPKNLSMTKLSTLPCRFFGNLDIAPPRYRIWSTVRDCLEAVCITPLRTSMDCTSMRCAVITI
ncbi:hypothetical protein D3C84_822730 [compost metagenome]